jgi:hypothetical protein
MSKVAADERKRATTSYCTSIVLAPSQDTFQHFSIETTAGYSHAPTQPNQLRMCRSEDGFRPAADLETFPAEEAHPQYDALSHT